MIRLQCRVCGAVFQEKVRTYTKEYGFVPVADTGQKPTLPVHGVTTGNKSTLLIDGKSGKVIMTMCDGSLRRPSRSL